MAGRITVARFIYICFLLLQRPTCSTPLSSSLEEREEHKKPVDHAALLEKVLEKGESHTHHRNASSGNNSASDSPVQRAPAHPFAQGRGGSPGRLGGNEDSGDVENHRFPCSKMLRRGLPPDSPCLRIEIHPSVPRKMALKVCEACSDRPCMWHLLTNLSHIGESRTPTGYLFEKAYVVHYSPRAFRKYRMVERLKGIGLTTDSEGSSDNVAMLAEFDAEDIPTSIRACLPQKFPPKPPPISGTRSPKKHKGCRENILHYPAGMMSLNLKHFSAYYDMLRRGYGFALVMEDDARYDSGSKLEGKFDIDVGYQFHTFKEIFNKEIEPVLPVEGGGASPRLYQRPRAEL